MLMAPKIRSPEWISSLNSRCQHDITTWLSNTTSLEFISTGSQGNESIKINERHPNCKGRPNTIFVHSWHENYKESIIKLPELITKFSKVVGHKLNTQKSAVFYTPMINNSKRKLSK